MISEYFTEKILKKKALESMKKHSSEKKREAGRTGVRLYILQLCRESDPHSWAVGARGQGWDVSPALLGIVMSDPGSLIALTKHNLSTCPNFP